MSLTPAQYVALKTELTTDPKGYGYAADWAAGNDQSLANLLNQIRPGEPIPQASLRAWQIFNAITPGDYQNMAANSVKQAYLQTLMMAGTIDLSNSNVKAALDLIFPAGATPTTNAAIHALYTRNGSRAETLFGAGASVSAADIAQAHVS